MTATLKDAVYGAAVGDALGVPYEFGWRGEFECTGMVGYGCHNQPAGTWSDDTSMLIATCDSIRACRGKIDTEDMRKRFLNWTRKGHYTPHGRCFDVGTTVIKDVPEDEIETSGYVVHTLEAALWCLLHTNSYKECTLKAVNLGRDTDTTACVAGALAGIAYGYESIPAEWIEKLQAKDTIDKTLFNTYKSITKLRNNHVND